MRCGRIPGKSLSSQGIIVANGLFIYQRLLKKNFFIPLDLLEVALEKQQKPL